MHNNPVGARVVEVLGLGYEEQGRVPRWLELLLKALEGVKREWISGAAQGS
jgi:hypothetical protein